jgi:hypothetical protein
MKNTKLNVGTISKFKNKVIFLNNILYYLYIWYIVTTHLKKQKQKKLPPLC